MLPLRHPGPGPGKGLFGCPGCAPVVTPTGPVSRPVPVPVTCTVCDDPCMADPVPAGSDVSSGTYQCTNCGYQLQVGSTKHLPPCPSCGNGHYESLSGGDSVNDPYPDRK